MNLNGYHLPGSAVTTGATWSYALPHGGALELRMAQCTPTLLTRQIEALLAARSQWLEERPVAEIVSAVGRVADRFLDPADSVRRAAETGVAAVTGLSRPMVALILDRMAADWREDALWQVLESELVDPRVLDDFTPGGRGSVRVRAMGPVLALHVFSGNVPGISVTSLIRTLLLKSATLGKTAAGEPVLAPLFARALREVDPGLGACIAVLYWAGGDEAVERCALERADAVIAYGGREAIASLRERTPAGARFLGYGQRLSLALIARERLGAEAARRHAAAAATAVATFDQHGCVSPHVVYVEEGGDTGPREWARMLASEMAALEARLPRGAVSPGEAAAIRQARGAAEFAQLAGQGHELHASTTGTLWTVIFDPSPEFAPSCLNRLVRVKPVASIDEVPARIASLASVLQTVGAEAPAERLAPLVARLGRLGVSRVASFERMPWPPPTWHHDGRPPLTDLVHWCDWEVP